jgi:Fe2+ or Zn2+ uptake regulation protein
MLAMRPVDRALDAGDCRARLEWASECCARADLQLTAARRAVLEFLCARTTPVVVETMVSALAASSCGHFVSFYRAVQRFEAAGLVRRVSGAGQRQCGHAVAIADLSALHELERRVAARTGYRIQYHLLEFDGICHRCQWVNTVLPS